MGIIKMIIDSFKQGLEDGREHVRNEERLGLDKVNIPVELIEPSSGRIVELKVTEGRDEDLFLLKNYAEGIEQYGVQWEIRDKNIMRMFLPNADMAEILREKFGK